MKWDSLINLPWKSKCLRNKYVFLCRVSNVIEDRYEGKKENTLTIRRIYKLMGWERERFFMKLKPEEFTKQKKLYQNKLENHSVAAKEAEHFIVCPTRPKNSSRQWLLNIFSPSNIFFKGECLCLYLPLIHLKGITDTLKYVLRVQKGTWLPSNTTIVKNIMNDSFSCVTVLTCEGILFLK